MTKKEYKARVVNKHDTEANWNKAVNFIPKQGEIIVYDIDEAYGYERFKIGDGTTIVSALPFSCDFLESAIESKVDIAQGTNAAGNVLGVGADGMVVAMPVLTGDGSCNWGDLKDSSGKVMSVVTENNCWKTLCLLTTTEDVNRFEISVDADGNPFSCQEIKVILQYTDVASTTGLTGAQYLHFYLNEQGAMNLYQGVTYSTTTPRFTKININLLGHTFPESNPLYGIYKAVEVMCWNQGTQEVAGMRMNYPYTLNGQYTCNTGEIHKLAIGDGNAIFPAGTKLTVWGR